GAISAANTANTAGKTFSIGVCPATYNESISWPNSTAGNTYSALLIRGLGASDSHDDFDQVYWSTNQAGVSPIELDATNPVGMQIENIVFNAVGGQPAIDWSAGINLSGHAINCEFRDPVEMETAGFWFHHCLFSADFDGEDSDDVFFIDCKFGTNAGIDLSSDTFSGVTVIGCDFVGGTSPKIQLTAGAVMNIIGNTFTGSNVNDCISIDTDTTVSQVHDIVISGNLFTYRMATNGALIRLTSDTGVSAGEIWNVGITGNTFTDLFTSGQSATTAWVKITGNANNKIFGIIVADNTFGANSSQGDTIEDRSGWTVLADYLERSVLGPNTLVGKVKYEVTNGANNLIIPASADDNGPGDSGALPTDEHNLLDGSSHPDTAADALTRGSLIAGNATPAWDELLIGGSARLLQSDGSDPSWIAVSGDITIAAGGAVTVAGTHSGSAHHTETHVPESHTGQGATAAELETLTDTSNADSLHKHDHGVLDGRSDDDHSQYPLLAGRSGGQTLIGGTGNTQDLTLQSTAGAIRGSVFLGSSSVFELTESTGGLQLPTTGVNAGILIGGDGLIYRSAPNILRTPDSLTVDSDLKVSGSLNLDADSTLTISSGSVTATGSYHTIAGESGADDNLDLIVGGVDGDLLILRPSSDAVTITVRHNQNAANANNILLSTNSAATLDDEDDVLVLLYDAGLDTNGAWIEVVRNNPNTAVDHGVIAGLGDDDHTQYILHSLAGAASDFLVASGANTFVKKTLAETGAILEGDIVHDNLQSIPANDHIDHTGVTLTAGSGIAGGGDISSSISFDLDINSLAAAVIAAGDFVPFWDITATATNKKITFANFEGTLSHDNLADFTGDEHFTQANITTVGTISSGTWQGTTVAINQGGTGQTTAQAAIDALSAVSGATNEHVLTKDTGTGNAKWKAAAGGGVHTILDGSTHSDSVADGVTRGSIIYGNATPKWDELVVGGADTFLGSDGTDVSYRTKTQVLTSLNVADGADVTGSNAPQAHKDSHDPNDGGDALDTANAAEISVVVGAGTGT
ncbi:hypothetical protein LCGC14_1669620, partial [marine sediment metagenome]